MNINIDHIEALLFRGAPPTLEEVRSTLARAGELKGLALEEAALLLSAEGDDATRLIESAAAEVKQKIFGRRVVFFAPLYLSNYCSNGCLYCGFRSGGEGSDRKALSPEEVGKEARSLEARGFKRLLLVTGEDPRFGLDYLVDSVRAVYRESGIRIVHVNAPPMDREELAELKRSGVGVYQAFQETYHRPTYERFHPTGRKKDFQYRLDVMDRALEAGFDDVGIGPLLGLYDYRFDTLATIAHSTHLYEKFGTHAHTVSVPRLRPAPGAELGEAPSPVSDAEMRRITAVFRLALPSVGVVVSTREPAELRERLIEVGASQLSAASSTGPGGYSKESDAPALIEQFETNDQRTLEEVMATVARSGYMPSLCTACYRSGRVGKSFTEKTSAGEMEKFCEANAILTLKEYLVEGRANGSEELFHDAIKKALHDVEDTGLKKKIEEKIGKLEEGERDLFF